MTKFIKDPQGVVNMSFENIDRIRKQSGSIDLIDINKGIMEISKTMNEARWSTQPRILLELVIVKLSSEMQSMQPVQPAQVIQPAQPVKAEAPLKADPQPPKDEAVSFAQEEKKAPAAPDQDFDCEAIWHAVFEDGEAAKGSFYMIGSSGRLTEIGEHHFTVEMNSDLVKSHAEKNRQLLENLMEKHTGKRRTMELKTTASGPAGEDTRSVEEIARDAGDLLGINVEIQ